jgi:hypothetical protein
MTFSQTPGVIKKFGRTPWRFQRTFQTPLKNLRGFVGTIMLVHPEISRGKLTVDQIVFEPKHLLALPGAGFAATEITHDATIAAGTREEVEALLEAALGDWLDFVFIPTPKPFVIYADHDEYCTFYASSRSNLNQVCDALSRAGFEMVEGYERK